jgi:2-dehydro-3-deoxyphosphogluconate aldolase/(4S)-4-hydroxy-2-oxoglutarate aldolase
MFGELDAVRQGTAVMAIFRNLSIDDAVAIAHRAWDVGIELVEIPIQSPEMVPTLAAVVKDGLARGKAVGAGTVISEEQVHLSRRLGAAFTVAPGVDRNVLSLSHAIRLPHLPGVASATDIQAALREKCDWVKAFPASILGAGWLSAMKSGPFPQVSFVATGGVDAGNAGALLSAGASMVAVGSALQDPRQVDLLSSVINMRG